MSFGSACAPILSATLRNFLRSAVRRLRKPRYLVPAALTVLYLGWALSSRPPAGWWGRLRWLSDLAGRAESIGTLAATSALLVAWLLGRPRPRLTFTEAEIQFLFPAPATRRQVVGFAVLRSVLQAGLVAALVGLLGAKAHSGSLAPFALALWVAVATIELHAAGASFASAWLRERAEGFGRRAAQFAALLLAGALASGAWAGVGGPLGWLLWPARVVARPFLAEGAGPFLLAILPALVLLALHIAWVLFAAERFEEAAVERAERAARAAEALRAGGILALQARRKPRRIPFRLRG